MIGIRGVPARAGGAERVVHELSRELTARGDEVLIYCRPHYVAGTRAEGIGRRIMTPGLTGKHTETLTHTFTAMIDVLRRKADVVHIHSPGPALWSWIAAAAKLPTVVTIHAPDWNRERWSLPGRVALAAGLAAAMRLADVVTAVSSELADELSHRFGRPVHFVPNAVRLPAPPAGSLPPWGLTSEGYGLYVGRIVPEKRLDLLIRAWRQSGRPEPLVVVGTEDEKAYARACHRLAGRNVRFAGMQFGQVLTDLYAHAAVVVQPSVLEGMSLVLLEAASHGRCILASDIAANRGTMAQAALYFSKDSFGGLTGQIRRCFEEAAMRESMGRSAEKLVQERYSWQVVSSRMRQLYDQAIRRRAR
ncbi:MAG: glycosyltransferase family 4 protein [Pseudomonadota bacterium]